MSRRQRQDSTSLTLTYNRSDLFRPKSPSKQRPLSFLTQPCNGQRIYQRKNTLNSIFSKNTKKNMCIPKNHWLSGWPLYHMAFFPTKRRSGISRGFRPPRAELLDELVGRSATETSALHFLELYLGQAGRQKRLDVGCPGLAPAHGKHTKSTIHVGIFIIYEYKTYHTWILWVYFIILLLP